MQFTNKISVVLRLALLLILMILIFQVEATPDQLDNVVKIIKPKPQFCYDYKKCIKKCKWKIGDLSEGGGGSATDCPSEELRIKSMKKYIKKTKKDKAGNVLGVSTELYENVKRCTDDQCQTYSS